MYLGGGVALAQCHAAVTIDGGPVHRYVIGHAELVCARVPLANRRACAEKAAASHECADLPSNAGNPAQTQTCLQILGIAPFHLHPPRKRGGQVRNPYMLSIPTPMTQGGPLGPAITGCHNTAGISSSCHMCTCSFRPCMVLRFEPGGKIQEMDVACGVDGVGEACARECGRDGARGRIELRLLHQREHRRLQGRYCRLEPAQHDKLLCKP